MKTVRHTTIFEEGSTGERYDWVEMQKFSLEDKERDTILIQRLFKANKENVGFKSVHPFLVEYALPFVSISQYTCFISSMEELIIGRPGIVDRNIQIGFPSLDEAFLFTSNNLEEIKQLACNISY